MNLDFARFEPFEADVMQDNPATAYSTIKVAELTPEIEQLAVRQLILKMGFQGAIEGEAAEMLDVLDNNLNHNE